MLGIIKLARHAYFAGDLCVARVIQCLLKNFRAGLRLSQLRLVVGLDRRAILSATVVALTHALGRIMTLPERG